MDQVSSDPLLEKQSPVWKRFVMGLFVLAALGLVVSVVLIKSFNPKPIQQSEASWGLFALVTAQERYFDKNQSMTFDVAQLRGYMDFKDAKLFTPGNRRRYAFGGVASCGDSVPVFFGVKAQEQEVGLVEAFEDAELCRGLSSKFVFYAISNLDEDGDFDVWRIDDNRQIQHLRKD